MPLPLTGTVSVTSGLDTFTWTGVPLTPLNCVAGASIVVNGLGYFVKERTDTTHGKFTRNYAEATNASRPAEIEQMSPDQVATATLNKRAADLFADLDVVEANGRGLFYRFSDSTADADPGPGYLRLNHATIASSTGGFIDILDAGGASVAGELDSWDDSTSATKGRLWLRSIADPSAFHVFRVTGIVTGSGYRKPVWTYLGGSGGFAANDGLMVFFVPSGDAGTNGTNGADGADGVDGADGTSGILDGGFLAGLRNKIINGDLDHWARALSFSRTTAGGYYVADRWQMSHGGSGYTVDTSRQSFALGQTAVPGNPRYFARITNTTAGSLSATILEQSIQGADTHAGREVTLTFYMKASTAFTFAAAASYFIQSFGTGGSPSAAVNTSFASLSMPDVAVTTGWKKFTVKGTLPSVTGKVLGSNNNDALRVYLSLPITNGLSIDIAHVSVVEGDATAEADPFSRRHPQQEAALCEYYYRKLADGATQAICTMAAYTTTTILGTLTFPRMRAAPALISSNGAAHFRVFLAGSTIDFSTLTSQDASDRSINLVGALTGAVAGQAGVVRSQSGASYLALDSEL